MNEAKAVVNDFHKHVFGEGHFYLAQQGKLEELIAQALTKARQEQQAKDAKVADGYAKAAGRGYSAQTSKRRTSECIAQAIREAE